MCTHESPLGAVNEMVNSIVMATKNSCDKKLKVCTQCPTPGLSSSKADFPSYNGSDVFSISSSAFTSNPPVNPISRLAAEKGIDVCPLETLEEFTLAGPSQGVGEASMRLQKQNPVLSGDCEV